MVKDQLSFKNVPVRLTFDSRAQGFSTPPLTRRRSSCPPSSPNLVRTHPLGRYQAFRESVPSLSRTTTSRRAPNWSSGEAQLVNTILNQPCRRRISTDRLNCQDSQSAASFEGDPGHSPVGKTLPHSYPTNKFRGERAPCSFLLFYLGGCIYPRFELFIKHSLLSNSRHCGILLFYVVEKIIIK